MTKLILVSFLLMYAHQAFEHVGHCHYNDHASLSSILTYNAYIQHDNSHNHYFEGFPCGHADHEHDIHQHCSEIHVKSIKPCRKTADCVTIADVKHISPDPVGDFVRHILPYGVGTQINSSIPQYIRAQSFLI